jgi:hypothetical protein
MQHKERTQFKPQTLVNISKLFLIRKLWQMQHDGVVIMGRGLWQLSF